MIFIHHLTNPSTKSRTRIDAEQHSFDDIDSRFDFDENDKYHRDVDDLSRFNDFSKYDKDNNDNEDDLGYDCSIDDCDFNDESGSFVRHHILSMKRKSHSLDDLIQ